jgi:hypothetical protein
MSGLGCKQRHGVWGFKMFLRGVPGKGKMKEQCMVFGAFRCWWVGSKMLLVEFSNVEIPMCAQSMNQASFSKSHSQ